MAMTQYIPAYRQAGKCRRVLFTHSYFLRFDPKQWKLQQPYAPLGTLYAAPWIREHGYPVALHDVQFCKSPDEILEPLLQTKPDYLVVYDDGFNYLTKMCLTNMRQAAFRMIALARDQGCRVIVSSSDATDHFEKYLQAGADYVLIGEGEQTLLELLQGLDAGTKDLSSIPGLAFQNENVPVKTAARNVMKDLDRLPLPAWDLVDLGQYRAAWKKHATYFSINIGTTRGCPFRCNWCAKPIYGNRYNARSPKNVVEELLYLKTLTEFEHVWFCDDIFGLKPGWVAEFARLVEESGMQFKFKIQSRADLLIQEHYVSALARAGCDSVWMGAESGSQKILDAMEKGITIAQIEQATGLLKEHGIHPAFFIQFGYLEESGEDIKKTIDMISRLRPHEIGISVSYPLPGTGFYEKVKAQLSQKSNWTDSDELALMYHNTYPPSFYRQLHRYVHRQYRMRMAFDQLVALIKKPGIISLPVLKKALSGMFLFPLVWLTKFRLQQLQKAT